MWQALCRSGDVLSFAHLSPRNETFPCSEPPVRQHIPERWLVNVPRQRVSGVKRPQSVVTGGMRGPGAHSPSVRTLKLHGANELERKAANTRRRNCLWRICLINLLSIVYRLVNGFHWGRRLVSCLQPSLARSEHHIHLEGVLRRVSAISQQIMMRRNVEDHSTYCREESGRG